MLYIPPKHCRPPDVEQHWTNKHKKFENSSEQ